MRHFWDFDHLIGRERLVPFVASLLLPGDMLSFVQTLRNPLVKAQTAPRLTWRIHMTSELREGMTLEVEHLLLKRRERPKKLW